MPESRVTLAELFRRTGNAHHQAFAATDGADPAWPEWYADHLRAPLSELFGVSFERGPLADVLRLIDAELERETGAPEWPFFYADWFLARYPTAQSDSALPS